MGVSDDKSPITVKAGSVTLREVHSFKYLGARFNAEATCVKEVKTRLGLARDRLDSLATLWRSRSLSNESKARLIQSINLADHDIWSRSLDLEQGVDRKHRGI